eukprot:gene13096-27648_t
MNSLALRKIHIATAISNQYYSQIGMYVGPSLLTPGAARVAVKVSNELVRILVTTNFRAASDGGGLNVYQHIDRGLTKLLAEQKEYNRTDVSEEDLIEPESNYDEEMIETLQTTPEINIHNLEVRGDKENSDSNELSPNKEMEGIDNDVFITSIGDKITNTKKTSKNKIRRKKKTKTQCASEISSSMIRNDDIIDQASYKSKPSELVVSSEANINMSNENDNLNIVDSNLRRSARQRERRIRRNELASVATDIEELETSCFADWTTHETENIYWSWSDLYFLQIHDNNSERDTQDISSTDQLEIGYKAVTSGVPKNFTEALSDPKWGQPARTELNTLIATKAIVEIDAELAREAIKKENADLVHLFPVYEEKIKNGETVYKVRLVGDGRDHHHAGETYSATPSREELFVILHVIAALDWDYAHIDEIRAFLNAPYNGKYKAFTKFRGDNKYYSILG